MRAEDLRKLVLPPGPILSVTLIGLVLLGSVLYYKAVSVQRRMEPVMAFLRPRMEFSGALDAAINRVFPEKYKELIIVSPDAVYAGNDLIYTKAGTLDAEAVAGLSRLVGEMIGNPETKRHINLILVTVRYPLAESPEESAKNRHIASKRAEGIMDAVLGGVRAPGVQARPYLASAAIGVSPESPRLDWVEFKIIHTDQFNLEMLNRL